MYIIFLRICYISDQMDSSGKLISKDKIFHLIFFPFDDSIEIAPRNWFEQVNNMGYVFYTKKHLPPHRCLYLFKNEYVPQNLMNCITLSVKKSASKRIKYCFCTNFFYKSLSYKLLICKALLYSLII